MFWRVAGVIADADAAYGASDAAVGGARQAVLRTDDQGTFEPNFPHLHECGAPPGAALACFVLPVGRCPLQWESRIYDTLKAMALVHQSGGGTGFSFSRLRPTGDNVRSTMGVASGPVSFMKLYDASTEVVKQGGTRRGANMGILRVDHPDIREFITCKNDTSQVTNFNISVAITDAFMDAVESGEDYQLFNPRTKQFEGTENAREIFNMIIRGAWMTGEPGTFFIDRANEYNPVPRLGSYEATNPCGEQPLLAYDVCNLGSVNVGKFVKEAASGVAPEDRVDWEALRRVVHLSTHFLDNVIDANRYPLPQISDLANRIRRIGLGVMGWADLLIRVGVSYSSPEGVELGRKLMAFVDEESRKASEKLAKVRGVFPEWEHSIWGPDATCARRPDGSRIRPERRLRNCNLTTVAPTGTISIFAGCSSGIEPLFAVAFMRNQAGALMPDVNPDFVSRAQREGWYSADLMERIASEGHIHFPEVPEEVQRVFVTAHDITPEWHVRMQAAFQEHTDSAISKTTNFPNEATEADVREIYELAFRLGCKGVTVYRDGSRPMQVLSTGKTGKTEATPSVEEESVRAELADAREENHRLRGEIDTLRAASGGCGPPVRPQFPPPRHEAPAPPGLARDRCPRPLGALSDADSPSRARRARFAVFPARLGPGRWCCHGRPPRPLGRLASTALRSEALHRHRVPAAAPGALLAPRAVGDGPAPESSRPAATRPAPGALQWRRHGRASRPRCPLLSSPPFGRGRCGPAFPGGGAGGRRPFSGASLPGGAGPAPPSPTDAGCLQCPVCGSQRVRDAGVSHLTLGSPSAAGSPTRVLPSSPALAVPTLAGTWAGGPAPPLGPLFHHPPPLRGGVSLSSPYAPGPVPGPSLPGARCPPSGKPPPHPGRNPGWAQPRTGSFRFPQPPPELPFP